MRVLSTSDHNQKYSDLRWLGTYAQKPQLCLEAWLAICNFVFGKLNQTPDLHRLRDSLKKIGIETDIWCDEAGKPNTSAEVRNHQKIGRNYPCPCGSGKKFKKCCEQ